MTDKAYVPTVAQQQRIHQLAIQMMQECQRHGGDLWGNVVVEMYRRVAANEFHKKGTKNLDSHLKEMKTAILNYIDAVTKQSKGESNVVQKAAQPTTAVA
jgi:hypothetical protein